MPAMIGAATLVPSASHHDGPHGEPAPCTCTSSPGSATAATSAIERLPPQPTDAAGEACHAAALS